MKDIIEKAVLQWFNITKDELYSYKETYPISGSRSVFMYLLFKDRMSFEEIQNLFGYRTQRAVELRIATVQLDINRDHGRYAIDVQEIEKIIEQLKNKE